jgi:hypothetical protein
MGWCLIWQIEEKTAITNKDNNCLRTLLLVTYSIAEYQGRGNTHYTLSARFIKKSYASLIDAESIIEKCRLRRICTSHIGRGGGGVQIRIVW